MISYKVIGLMSGTSLDGVDVALCEFIKEKKHEWQYKILCAQTYPYSNEWHKRLATLHKKDANAFVQTDVNYAGLLAQFVNRFCEELCCDTDIIASHGHTIFHNPLIGLTSQIGNGATIAALTHKIVISDFRSMDVALNGQGAPLVPIGDKLLFSDFEFCINLGGFANISYDENNERVAFDICPANIILNYIFNKGISGKRKSLLFDKNGELASKGKLNVELFNKLNNLNFYTLKYPKSLGREWLEIDFLPVVDSFDISLEDKLNTVTQHIAYQLASVLNKLNKGNILITGGGAFNDFLILCLRQLIKNKKITIPENIIIEYKEALIFAFLGLLRYLEETNCLKSVTGALKNSCSGAIYLGNK